MTANYRRDLAIIIVGYGTFKDFVIAEVKAYDEHGQTRREIVDTAMIIVALGAGEPTLHQLLCFYYKRFAIFLQIALMKIIPKAKYWLFFLPRLKVNKRKEK